MINHKHSILTTIDESSNGELMSTKPKSNGQTIFVTGVNGHIGNQIVRDLLENGYKVKSSVRDLNDDSKTAHVIQHAKDVGVEERLELVEGDILDADNWAEMISGCDSLFHTATIYSNTKDGQLIIDTALLGTTHLLTAARDAGIKDINDTTKGLDWKSQRENASLNNLIFLVLGIVQRMPEMLLDMSVIIDDFSP